MSETQGLSGLINFGNTCYMNSAIQCMSNIPQLRDYFISKKFGEDINRKSIEMGLVVQWYKLLCGIWENNCVISPNSFRNEVRILAYKQGINMNFVGNGQNDVQEFMQFLITSMHNCLSKKVKMTITGKVLNELDKKALEAMKSWKLFFKNDFSYFVDLFYGQHASFIYDLNENLMSTTYEPYCFLTLPIPNTTKKMNIYDCLNLYTTYEKLDGDNKWYHEEKKEYIECYKQIKLWTSPKILIVVFKRFDNEGNKNNAIIDFPLENLTLSDYSVGYSPHKNKYNLLAISNHIGSLTSGHYYAYCRNENKKWYEYNDRTVREISKEQLISPTAYCLFYEKINS